MVSKGSQDGQRRPTADEQAVRPSGVQVDLEGIHETDRDGHGGVDHPTTSAQFTDYALLNVGVLVRCVVAAESYRATGRLPGWVRDES